MICLAHNYMDKPLLLASQAGATVQLKPTAGTSSRKIMLNRSRVVIHTEHRFQAASSKLCQNWLRHWRGTLYLHAFVHLRGQRSSKGLGITKDSNHGNITKDSKLTITKDGNLTICGVTKTVREAT